MSRNIELRQARDLHIRARFRFYRKKHPRWAVEFVIEAVAKEVFLSEVTIVKILKADNFAVPTAPTISKMNKARAVA